jgi:hypothetical protein
VKRISPATVTFAVMAIVLGLVAAYVVRQALENRRYSPEPTPIRECGGVRAVNIPKNTRITEGDVSATWL